MKKIKDRFILGSACALATALPIQLYDAYLHRKGITDVPYGMSASRIFLTKKAAKTPGGKAVSILVNSINAGLACTALTYTLSLTGKDKALLKGAGFGSLMWVMGAGLLSKIGLGIESKKPNTPLMSFAEHSVYFAICAYLITKLGDDSLFPDKQVNEQEKIPLVYAGEDQTTGKEIDQQPE